MQLNLKEVILLLRETLFFGQKTDLKSMKCTQVTENLISSAFKTKFHKSHVLEQFFLESSVFVSWNWNTNQETIFDAELS